RLAAAGILVSRSTIPADPRPPYNPSGIRIGTPAITTRGLKPSDMKNLVQLIDNILQTKNDRELKAQVKKLSKKFPLSK
ncbi:MAG TPA: serine hydroxymethyltransferase, partial [bacterium]|nr:serine hydroxymethyltransferase [bacterium]